ncbi:MAG TPA: hypothetical protein VEM59_08570 [Acidimicrobiia bacterium]|nr:hypothetical protein [Acidimicrobiia bacterium]
MNDTKWEQYGAAAGLLFVVLVVVSAFVASSPPAIDESAREVAKYFRDHDTAIRVGAFLAGLAALSFLWFLGSLWSRLRRPEETRRLATITAGGGVVTIALVLSGFAIKSTIALRLRELGPLGARFFWTLSNVVIGMASFSIAVLVAATSIAALRTKVFPAWLGWVGVVLSLAWVVAGIGVASDNGGLFTYGFVVFLVWLVWILVISFFIFRPQAQTAA